jgi:signal transduction histidine kinase
MSTTPGHILVVDDNELNRDLLARHLDRLGHTVALAHHGRQALDMLRAHAYDALLLDIMMPVVDGYQVLEQIKADPQLRHLPVIMLSAVNDLDSVVRCIELGADDYLFKPFKPQLLKARLSASLEKKRLRDQEQALIAAVQAADQAKNDFISFAAHELKSPLTAIGGYADMLAGEILGALTVEQAHAAQAIRSSTRLMNALIADLSDIARIESGHMQLDYMAVAMDTLVMEVAQSLRGQLEAKQQSLALDLPDDLPRARADRTRMVQVITNLLSNSHKYTPEHGRIRIAVEHTTIDPSAAGGPGAIHIAIQDSGIGMSEADQARLFERFFRSSDAQARQSPGTGLGLHITKNLVEMQGGRIWFESTFRVGTTFHVLLPLAS